MKKKKIGIILLSIFSFFLVVGIYGVCYFNSYYHATGVEEFLESTNDISIQKTKNKLEYIPNNPSVGIVFYPGAKVEYTAYSELCFKLAENGYYVVLYHMPCNFAIFDISIADGIQTEKETIENWYIMGHSLGGAMAAVYVNKHKDSYTGLILLASYSTKDLENSNLKVLSIYGSNDHVLNTKKYNSNKKNLPLNYQEYIIEGGNHANFGSYGIQKKDGIATISKTEQIEKTCSKIISFINN